MIFDFIAAWFTKSPLRKHHAVPNPSLIDRETLRDALVIKMAEAALGMSVRKDIPPSEILDALDNLPGSKPNTRLGEQHRMMANAAIDFLRPELIPLKKDKS